MIARRHGSRLDVLLCGIAVVLFLVSLLAVVKAPTYRLWQVSILVTEAGYWLAPLGLLFLIRQHRSRVRRLAAALGVSASILLVSSPVRALLLSRRLAESEQAPPRAAGSVTDSDGNITPRRLRYPAVDGTPIDLDFYYPPSVQRAPPIVVVIHSGSWRGGDQTEFPKLNQFLAKRGYAVAAIAYRLVPQHRFPAQLQDVHAAVSYLEREARVLNVDSSSIVLLGRSAGGHLALLAAYTARDPAIRGAISLYGPTDLLWGYDHPSAPLVHDSRGILRDFIGGTPATHASLFRQASPISYAGNAVPTLMIHGGRDELVFPGHSRRLTRALREADRTATYIELPWATHACDYVFDGPCGRISRKAVLNFLGNVTSEFPGSSK